MKVTPGIKHEMVLAGTPFGCETHHPGRRTIPCYTRLTGCSLACPFCKFARRFTVWVPLIDPKAKRQQRIVVQGGKRTWESLQDKKPGDVVMIGKGTEERATILFNSANELAIAKARLDLYRVQLPHDIRPWLFHLWQMRELSEHFGLPFFASIRTEEIEKRNRTLDEDGPARTSI